MRKIISLFAMVGVIALMGAGCEFEKTISSFTDSTDSSDTAMTELGQTFFDEELGYGTDYPDGWMVEYPDEYTTLFSGEDEEDDSWFVTVNIQNIATQEAGGVYGSLTELDGDLKVQLRADNALIFDETPYSHTAAEGTDLRGRQFVAEYTLEGVEFKQWQISLSQEEYGVYYTWGYTAPVELYDEYLPIAEAMLASWEITE